MSRLFSLIIIHAILSCSANAEKLPTDTRSIILDGKFSYTSSGPGFFSYDNGRRVGIEFNPSAGIVVLPGLAVGGTYKLDRYYFGAESWTSYGAGPFLTYYFGGNKSRLSISKKTFPYITASFIYSKSKYRDNLGDVIFIKSDDTVKTGALGIGLLHTLSDTVGLFGELEYRIHSLKSKYFPGAYESNTFISVVGFSIFL